MPYQYNEDLPESMKKHLPHQAQDIYREAFNHAWEQYSDIKRRMLAGTQEEVACRVAWTAVNKKYVKDGDMWVAKEYA